MENKVRRRHKKKQGHSEKRKRSGATPSFLGRYWRKAVRFVEKKFRRRKRGHAAKQEHGQSLSLSVSPSSRFKVLIALLFLSVLSGVAISKLSTKEVTTPESAESIEIKMQMLNQFIQKESGLQDGGETPADSAASGSPAR